MGRAILLVAFLGLAVCYYYLFGAGPTPSELGELAWWRPRGWALRWESLAALKELREAEGAVRLLPVLLFLLPVLALAIPLLALFKGAVMRTVIVGVALTGWAFVYYGYLAEGIWRFFSWRAPAATLSFSLLLSALLFAPSLLRSAARLSLGWRALAVVAGLGSIYLLSTEVTGTNPELRANLSPWPVLTLFGLLLAGYVIASWHVAAGVGEWIWGRLSGTPGAIAGIATAAVVGGTASLWVFESAGPVSIVVLGLVAALYAIAASARASDRAAAGGARIAAGALLAAAIFASNLSATRAQEVARDVTAARVLDALRSYREAEGGYPDELAQLVPEYLDEVPRARMGWIPHRHEEFTYSNFGDSFALEFASVLWVQCAYSPPYYETEDEELEAEEEIIPDVAAGEDLGLAEAWSCESAPPKLW
jgi:hypothetical protein